MNTSNGSNNNISNLGDINTQDEIGETLLMRASWKGDLQAVKSLIQAGASLDIQSKTGKTALMIASYNGYRNIVDSLIIAGASVDIQSKTGETALMIASYIGYETIVDSLIIGGASVDMQDTDGKTALMIASYNGHETIVYSLIEGGASIDIPNKNGETAIIYSLMGCSRVTRETIEEQYEIQCYNGRDPLYYNSELEIVNYFTKRIVNRSRILSFFKILKEKSIYLGVTEMEDLVGILSEESLC